MNPEDPKIIKFEPEDDGFYVGEGVRGDAHFAEDFAFSKEDLKAYREELREFFDKEVVRDFIDTKSKLTRHDWNDGALEVYTAIITIYSILSGAGLIQTEFERQIIELQKKIFKDITEKTQNDEKDFVVVPKEGYIPTEDIIIDDLVAWANLIYKNSEVK